ncbi:MAG: hypothetical protein DRO67_01210 [Candidatus Asgardarchaeum californiense]|nr:MAG: hypothetical protein DRO67_01210 [Candidatus Asgardarchaeum californiense]
MSKMTGYNNNTHIPKISDAGHVISSIGVRVKGTSQVSDLDKLRTLLRSICPVNKNIPTKMSKNSFIRACLKFRKLAEKDKNRKDKHSVTTPTGFRSSNKNSCLDCVRGNKIENGKDFEPPVNMTFIELSDIVDVERVAIKRRKNKKRAKWEAGNKISKIKKPVQKPVNTPSNTSKERKKICIKLTKEDVLAIRRLYDSGYRLIDICEKFPKVTKSTIHRAARRESWKNIKDE